MPYLQSGTTVSRWCFSQVQAGSLAGELILIRVPRFYPQNILEGTCSLDLSLLYTLSFLAGFLRIAGFLLKS